MAIERDLHELLYCHDCVIVPQWGGFLTHYRPARLDEARRLVQPPGKDLSFNRNLTRNDGLLTDHLAKRQGISFDQAAGRIELEIADWRRTLDRDGRLELPHIGIFYRDGESNLQFDPDKRADHHKDAFGLRPVTAVPIEQTRTVPVLPLVKPEPVLAEVRSTNSRRNPVLLAAAVLFAALFGAGAVWVASHDGGVQWSSLSPFGPRSERSYVPPSLRGIPEVTTAGEFSLPEEVSGIRTIPLGEADSVLLTVDLGMSDVEEAAIDTTLVVVPRTEPMPQRLRFHVIGGCFAQPENADRFLSELQAKGFNAVRLPRNGDLHPVAFGSFAERSDALEIMAQVRNTGTAQAWLLVR